MSNLRTLMLALTLGALVVAGAPASVLAQSAPSDADEARDDVPPEDTAGDAAGTRDADAAEETSEGIVIEGVARPRGVIELPGLGDDAQDGEEAAPGALVIQRGAAGVGAGNGSRTIRLSFERNGASVLIPAKVGRIDVYFVLDTGASYTTLTSEVARQARITPEAGAPTTLMQTAGGVREARFGMMSSLQLNQTTLRHVSYTLCDACGFGTYRDRPVVGLLGLNVLQRFQMNLDSAAGVVELTPSPNFRDQSVDMRPWLTYQIKPLQVHLKRNALPRLAVEVRNMSGEQAERVVVEFRCQLQDGSVEHVRTPPTTVPARSVVDTELTRSVPACRGWQASVVEGYWR
ncbi:hypothetical protein FRC96_18155 [Lujinxingia vulgaris]|uniref:Peptidase A2 domain-containing protein n=1 Tax=Lujinxingia vulgaris TaxID=2600176 RepID=A0A5C6WUZ1_9DELT|nr:retropepsin-like aspartic protease [Lujinxingia vulgaris]TXD32291.1 hypothetical protein FRC96_18155 [Lujinxingia vulgaris]